MRQVSSKTVEANKPAAPSVRQMAYELFQAALMDRRLRPGQMVGQRDLVEMLNLSIGALRELLPRLEAEGLVSVLPQRGIQITAIDLPMIRDAFQMRTALEREAVIDAVRRMADDELHQQRRLHCDIIAAVQQGATPELLERGQEIDTGFHMKLILATGNELLLQAYNVNAIRIRLIKLDRIKLSALVLPEAFGDHLAIIDAVLARDTGAAIDAIDRHMMHARMRAMEL